MKRPALAVVAIAVVVVVVVVAAVAVSLAVASGPAAAAFSDEDGLGCQGALTVLSQDGGRVSFHLVDARDSTVRAPREGRFSWRASVRDPADDYQGSLSLRLAWWTYELGSWEGTNPSRARSAAGSGAIDDFFLSRDATWRTAGPVRAGPGSCWGGRSSPTHWGPWRSWA
ncbi:MAG: hypothetical protein AB1673_13920 [Actinomycetota bacterium]